MQLRHQGLSLQAIGEQLGISRSRVHQVCKDAERVRREAALELARERRGA